MSWVISSMAVPARGCSSAHQLEDLRLDGDVERGGRLVGDQQLRARRRAPWRSSPAGACRRRADADSRRARCARRSGCRPGRSSSTSRSARCAPRRGRDASRSDLADLVADREHRVEAGHRLLEDHADAAAAHRLRSSASPSAQRSRPSKRTCPPVIMPVRRPADA